MKISVFILFLGATFLWTQNSQAVDTPSGGHQLSNPQKNWVQKNRQESNVKKGTTGKNFQNQGSNGSSQKGLTNEKVGCSGIPYNRNCATRK